MKTDKSQNKSVENSAGYISKGCIFSSKSSYNDLSWNPKHSTLKVFINKGEHIF
jgi:hypothetical protein